MSIFNCFYLFTHHSVFIHSVSIFNFYLFINTLKKICYVCCCLQNHKTYFIFYFYFCIISNRNLHQQQDKILLQNSRFRGGNQNRATKFKFEIATSNCIKVPTYNTQCSYFCEVTLRLLVLQDPCKYVKVVAKLIDGI